MFSVKPQRGHSFTTLGLKTDAGGAGSEVFCTELCVSLIYVHCGRINQVQLLRYHV